MVELDKYDKHSNRRRPVQNFNLPFLFVTFRLILCAYFIRLTYQSSYNKLRVMDFNSSNLPFNKSFSAPDISSTGPLFRRVVIEEQYFSHNQNSDIPSLQYVVSQTYNHKPESLAPLPNGQSTFPTRHFSCDQLSSIKSDEFDETFHIRTTSTPLRNNMLMPPDSPMDVDLSESINKTIKTEADPNIELPKKNIMDYVDLTFQGATPVLKKRHINSKSPSKRQRIPSTNSSETVKSLSLKNMFSKMNIAIFIVIVVSIPLYDRLNYIREIDLNEFNSELKTSLVGQREAIAQLTQALNSFSNSSTVPQTHLLSLVGTTGVGKTLCVNVIKRKFMPKQIVEIDIESFDLSAYRDSLNFYKSVPYLLILDNIRYKNMAKVIQVLNSVPENKWILAVVVFNIQDTEDVKSFHVNEELYDQIPKELDKLGFILHTVNFHRFNDDFIKYHLENFSHVYSSVISKIPNWKAFLAQHDFDTLGFKGLFEKMNVFGQ